MENVSEIEILTILTNWYMHNPALVLENDTHKLLWDFNRTDGSSTPGQKTRLIIITQKENLLNCRLYCPAGPQNKTEGM